jgi:SnoaL-like domain
MGSRWSMSRSLAVMMVMAVLMAASGRSQPPREEKLTEAERAEQRAALQRAAQELEARRQHLDAVLLDARKQDVSAILDDFHGAAAKADYDTYFAHWSPVSVFLGTDATERWVGQEFRDYAKKRFDTGKGWTYRPHDRHITLAPDGAHAFFDELLENEKYGTCRGSGVLRKMDGAWWIMQYNLSIPVPNELAEKVVGMIREMPKPPPGEGKHKE